MHSETNTLQKISGDCRVVIDRFYPRVEDGTFPIKRAVGDIVRVEADVFADGHDSLSVSFVYRRRGKKDTVELEMEPQGNDLWTAQFIPHDVGFYECNIIARVDHYATWLKGFQKKEADGQKIAVELLMGAELIKAAAQRASGEDATVLRGYAEALCDDAKSEAKRAELLRSESLHVIVQKYPDRSQDTTLPQDSLMLVEPRRAVFSTWYEFFPRSFGAKPGKHGTFKTAAKFLPHIADMGFDIVYLPPIHPIGNKFRKGKNNTLVAEKSDPGSPWAIGSKDGGHKDVHPELGTLEDFDAFREEVRRQGMELALDIAFQCSPDHPYVKEHPEWFKWRPDGSVQYAENPPKKYQDILPFNFECSQWRALWEELKSIFTFWIDRGVKVFRVDNPHTKPLEFWRWCIDSIKQEHPEVIFLAEAFTRPKVKYRLAKGGFTHGYTYFTWRNTKEELTEYMKELCKPSVRDVFWPNFWPNTPDILHECLQFGGRSAFMARAVLAGTLSSNYGMYGPAMELCEHVAFPGREEYDNNEKYEIKAWDLDRPGNIRELITRINYIRRNNPALQRTHNLTFVEVDNPSLIAYIKHTPDLLNIVLVVVNLDFNNIQEGWLNVPLDLLQMEDDSYYMVQDMLPESGGSMPDTNYMWQGAKNYVKLDPHHCPAHVFRIFRKVRRENDFDYWL